MCPDIEMLARSIMTARQSGMDLTVALKKASHLQPIAVANLAKGMVADAFRIPLASEKDKIVVINAFAQSYKTACINKLR